MRTYRTEEDTRGAFIETGRLSEYVEAARQGAKVAGCKANERHAEYAMTRNPGSWDDNTSYKKALDLATTGWAAGRDKLQQFAETLQANLPEPKSIRRKARWSDDGDEIDMQRVYAGQLDRAWRGPRRVTRSAPRVISILGPIGQNCGYSAEQLFWSGAAAVVLADLLEEAGYRVALYGVINSWIWGSSNRDTHIVEVKGADEPMALDTVALAYCHGGFFRRVGFNALTHAPWDIGSNLGQARHSKAQLEEACQRAYDAGLMSEIPEVIMSSVNSEAGARALIHEAIAKLDEQVHLS